MPLNSLGHLMSCFWNLQFGLLVTLELIRDTPVDIKYGTPEHCLLESHHGKVERNLPTYQEENCGHAQCSLFAAISYYMQTQTRWECPTIITLRKEMSSVSQRWTYFCLKCEDQPKNKSKRSSEESLSTVKQVLCPHWAGRPLCQEQAVTLK